MMKCQKVGALLVGACAVLSASAATYYVDAEKGDDGYDGLAPESAFKSFAYAVSQLPNSSTLVVAKGRYEMTNSAKKALKGCYQFWRKPGLLLFVR